MKTIESSIELTTNDTNKQLVFSTKYLVQEHFTFKIAVKSREFRGVSSFCLSKTDMSVFTDQLRGLHKNLDGTGRINDYDSDAFVEFSAESNGHILVSGQIGGSSEDHFLRFSFETDQTSLPDFIRSFEELQIEVDQ